MEEHEEHNHEQHGHHEHDDHHEHEISCGCGHCHHEHEHNHEHDEDNDEMSLKRILLSLVIFGTALILSHLDVIKNLSASQKFAFGGTDAVSAGLMALYFFAYLNVGLPVVKNAVYGILHGDFLDEQFLMSIASIGALCLGEYPEAVAVMIFYQLGEYFQDYAVGKSKKSIKELMKLRPDTATLLQDGKEIEIAAEDVKVGQTILVKAGERIPLDGIITKGTSYVDTSVQTGESVPRQVYKGKEVLAGFINIEGVIEIQVQKTFGDSSVSRILELVEHATSNKAKPEKFIKKFAKIYTPAVCIAALVLAIVPPLLILVTGQADLINQGQGGQTVFGAVFAPWISRALIFLVVSCPCALVISVPLSFFGGIGSCSRKGILIKGSNSLETLSKVSIAVFDKTGTLTQGNFVVSASHPSQKLDLSEEELIALATHAEYYSNHPIAKSLRTAHSCELCGKLELTNIKEILGQGLTVTIKGQKVLVGNELLMHNNNVENFEKCTIHNKGTIVHVAIDGQYAGHIEIADQVKNESKQAIELMKKMGVKKTYMFTGDEERVATVISNTLGIDTVYSKLLPQDKVNYLERIIKLPEVPQEEMEFAYKTSNFVEETPSKKTVMFVGDGINDAPVLARADVGVAMEGLGSDAAIEASDVVVMSGNLMKLVQAMKISKQTMRIVNQNIVFSLIVKFAIMILGSLGLANMWLAVFGDVGVTFLAVLNALRLLK